LIAAALVLAACDRGPEDIVEQAGGRADNSGVILTFDIVVAGALPQGTPMDGSGLRAAVSARDTSSGLFSRGVVVDEEGFSFENATSWSPGPFKCDESTCRARLHGFLAGVPGEILEYSIRAAYAPDWDGSSPPGFRIDVVQVREGPVRELFYWVPVNEGDGLVGAVVQLDAETPVGDPPLGWFDVQYAEVWRPASQSPRFDCLADGCEQAKEVVFANDVGGAPTGPMRVKGWLSGETDPTLTVTNETHRDGVVVETALSVLDEYRVTIDHPFRDLSLPLLVDIEWAGGEFDQFRIDDEYAANRLRVTAMLAETCRGTSCTFLVGRTSNPSLTEHPPSELIVTVVPWTSETDKQISISITD
jgi:hypothetical protein